MKKAARILITVLLLLVGAATIVAANEPATFNMSKVSVRAGEATVLSEVDPCPNPVNSAPWGNYVEVSFTDGLGVTSRWSTTFDEQGHWREPISMIPPYKRVVSYNPPIYTSDAWPGAGIIEAKCTEMGTVTQEYASSTLTINGPSAGFVVSPGTLKPGKSMHVEPVLPCPSGSTWVSGIMSTDTGSAFHPLEATVDMNGSWSIDSTVPTGFPQEWVLIDITCHTSTGIGIQGYAAVITQVTSDVFVYAGWGDSFSSAEGVEPFENGTGGTNGCHRSVDAYPRVLERDSSLKLHLGGDFVACSGATTAGITLSDGTNPAQMDTLTANTDLVTMTIGGNNMPFSTFATACILPLQGETCAQQPYDNAVASITNNVTPQIEYMLETIRDRLLTLGNADATVLVLGYPQMVPETWYYGAAGCGWLQPAETPAIRDVTHQLNTAIKNKVNAIGHNFHFISATDTSSPFIGHELCRSTVDTAPTYFNNVVVGQPDVYTFHPNKAGQEAYASLVKNWLSAHPLS